MLKSSKLTTNESVAIDCIKAISVLSVIAAHTVRLSDFSFYSKIVSSLWNMFGHIGVVAFLIIGGFFYTRSENDGKAFWKKKFFRIIIPWLVCSLITYTVKIIFVESTDIGLWDYIKWIFGSGNYHYYVTIYLLFLFIFKWFYNNDKILYCLIVIHIIALTLNAFGISTTLPFDFFTDYLNPLYWIGYFSAGILIRKHGIDKLLQKSRSIPIISFVIALIAMCISYFCGNHTYFHILTYIYSICFVAVIAKLCYKLSKYKVSAQIRKIGTSSYCIYLLHMQIVQFAMKFIPESDFRITFAPFISLLIMVTLVSIGVFICNKLPFGDKIKSAVGL